MTKCYIVVKSRNGEPTQNICAFANEGEAEKSASSHRSEDTKAWVDEVNYYGL